MSSSILKWTTLLAIASAVMMAALGIASQFYPPIYTRIEWYISILLLVLAALLAYVYSRMEVVEKRTELIIDKLGLEAIEIFRTRDELFNRMLEITINSRSVSTQMFSDAPVEIGTQMENYFKKVGEHTRKTPTMVFRRIVTLGNARKIIWLMELLNEMVGTENFSLAYIEVDHKRTPLLCVHVVEKEDGFFTFVFHTVRSSGEVYAFLIRSSDVGRVTLDFYNGLWEKSPKLMEGRQIQTDTIRELAQRYGIENSEEYLKLTSKFSKYGQ